MSLWKYATVGATIAAGVGLACSYAAYKLDSGRFRKKLVPKAAAPKSKTKDTSKSTDSKAAPAKELGFSDAAAQQAVLKILTLVRSQGMITRDSLADLLKLAEQITPKLVNYEFQTRFQLLQLLSVCSDNVAGVGSSAERKAAMQKVKQVVAPAIYELADAVAPTPAVSNMFGVFRLRAALKMGQVDKIIAAYEPMAEALRENRFSPEQIDQVILIMTQMPVVGRFKTYVDTVEQPGEDDSLLNVLQMLHNESIKSLSADPLVLYEFAKKRMEAGDATDVAPEGLLWQDYDMQERKIKLTSASLNGKEATAEELPAQGSVEWKDLEGDRPVSRSGAVVKLTGFTDLAFPLTGVIEGKKLFARGFADINVGGVRARHEEVVEAVLESVDEQGVETWTGSWTLTRKDDVLKHSISFKWRPVK